MTPVMQSMKMDDQEIEAQSLPMAMPTRESYPYGLRICLTSQELSKLNLDPAEAVVGGMIHLHGMAKITSVSSNEIEGGDPCQRVELQICDLAIESEDDENAMMEQRQMKRRSAMYDRSNIND